MKLYIINPMYTSLFLVIVLSAYVSSLSLYITGGKTYLNNEFEIIYGGPSNVITEIDGSDFTGVKRVRKLSSKEIFELKKIRYKGKEIEKKQEKEERKREQEEKEREMQREEKEKKKERKQEEEKRQRKRKIGEMHRIKGSRRDIKKPQRKTRASQYEMVIVQSNSGQHIRRTLSNKQNTPLGRSPRRKNVYAKIN